MSEEILAEEEQASILTLTDENGEEIEFEFLDLVEYEGDEYIILLPVEAVETEVVVLKVEPIDEENESYVSVNDEQILNEVYAIFKERFKDILTFED
jgi:uncharacterized protein YrzB (UPF0473 family)